MMHGKSNIKLKQSHYRPLQAPRFLQYWCSHISRQSTHEVGKFVNHKQRPSSPIGNIPGTLSCFLFWLVPRSIVRLESLCQWNISMTTPVIESATFLLVAQCPKQLRHPMPTIVQCAVQFVTESQTSRHTVHTKAWNIFTTTLLNI